MGKGKPRRLLGTDKDAKRRGFKEAADYDSALHSVPTFRRVGRASQLLFISLADFLSIAWKRQKVKLTPFYTRV